MANEFLRNRFSKLCLLVALYALASFSFFTFFLPIICRDHRNVGVPAWSRAKRGRNAARGAADLSTETGPIVEGSGIGRRTGDRPYWRPDRILFSEQDSSCAALNEIRRDVSGSAEARRPVCAQLRPRMVSSVEALAESVSSRCTHLLFHRRLRLGGAKHDRLPPLVLPNEQRLALDPRRQDFDQDCRRSGRRLPGL